MAGGGGGGGPPGGPSLVGGGGGGGPPGGPDGGRGGPPPVGGGGGGGAFFPKVGGQTLRGGNTGRLRSVGRGGGGPLLFRGTAEYGLYVNSFLCSPVCGIPLAGRGGPSIGGGNGGLLVESGGSKSYGGKSPLCNIPALGGSLGGEPLCGTNPYIESPPGGGGGGGGPLAVDGGARPHGGS